MLTKNTDPLSNLRRASLYLSSNIITAATETNLLAQPDPSSWSGANLTLTLNEPDPWATTTAIKCTDNSTNGIHGVGLALGAECQTESGVYELEIWTKSGTESTIAIVLCFNAGLGQYMVSATLNAATGAISPLQTTGYVSGTGLKVGLWYQWKIKFFMTSGSNGTFNFYNKSSIGYVGTGQYIWVTAPIVRKIAAGTSVSPNNLRPLSQSTIRYQPNIETSMSPTPGKVLSALHCNNGTYLSGTSLDADFAANGNAFSIIWSGYLSSLTNLTGSIVLLSANDAGSNKLEFGFTDSSGPKPYCTQVASGTITTVGTFAVSNVFHCIALVCNGTTAQWYQDGVAIGSPVAFALGSFTPTSVKVGCVSGIWSVNTGDIVTFKSALSSTEVLHASQQLMEEKGLTCEPWEVILTGGQSNNVGQLSVQQLLTLGLVSDTYCGVPVFRRDENALPSGSNYTVSDGFKILANSPPITSQQGNLGPEYRLARELSLRGRKVAIIKFSMNGAAIQTFVPGGGQNAAMLAHYQLGLSKLPRYRIIAFLWAQGEADTGYPEQAAAFEGHLTELINDIRTNVPAPNVPIIIHKMSNNQTAMIYRNELNVAIDAFVASDANAYATNTNDISINSDFTHFDTRGQWELGRRDFEIIANL
jgi:hypothetical protein